VNGEMQLSKIGAIAQSEWLKTAELRNDMNIILDEFIVMPNHFHCMIYIGNNQYNTCRDAMHCVSTNCRDAMPCVSTNCRDATHCVSTAAKPYKNKFGAQSKNLSSIIRGFKIGVTSYARKHTIYFAWQERFHDRIIRDNTELENVRAYIYNNPQNWNKDEYYITENKLNN